MKNSQFTLGALATVAAIAGAIILGSSVWAQTTGPTQTPAMGMRGYGVGMMAQGRVGGPANSLVAVAAQTLSVNQVDLVAMLNNGQTIADVAKAKGVALDKIVDAFLAPRAGMLQNAVSAGRLTQVQADANLVAMKANVMAQLNAMFTPLGYGAGAGFIDANGDGVCDNLGANSQAGTSRGPMNRGGRMGR